MITCIANPSCRGFRDRWHYLADSIGDHLPGTPILFSDSEETISRHASEQPPHAIILVVGGDGTLSAAVEGALRGSSRPRIAWLPWGRGNDLFRSLGRGREPLIHFLKRISDGPFRFTLDLGRIESSTNPARTFVNMASLGVTATVAQTAARLRATPLSAHAYRLGALTAGIGRPFVEVTELRVDGVSLQLPSESISGVLIHNGAYGGGGFQLSSTEHPTDGRMGITLLPASRYFRRSLSVLRSKSLARISLERHSFAHSLRLSLSAPVRLERDGELFQNAVDSISVTVMERAIALECPVIEQTSLESELDPPAERARETS